MNCLQEEAEDYSVSLHIISMLVLTVVSFLGTLLPLVCLSMFRESGLALMSYFKMFGAGVLLSTALIHMLTPAVKLLSSPCLPKSISSYEGFAGSLTLMGLFGANLLQIG
jgi:solute carrier family 39 (zinc transporter), member 1/2/3